jgi:hypothetical protein
MQCEAWADEIVQIAYRDDLDPHDKRVRIDTLKWLCSKLMLSSRARWRTAARLGANVDPSHKYGGNTEVADQVADHVSPRPGKTDGKATFGSRR